MQGEISAALARAAADDKVDAVVLSGTGSYYCVSAWA
jgi:enoyl-CoA hydratase/carnithine racemase